MKALLSLIISGALVVSGYAQTRNVLVGTNNVVVQPTNFWSADASNARTGLGLGTAATNPASAFQPASSALTNLVSGNGGALTNLQATNLVGLIPTSNIPPIVLTNIGTITISQGGTGATNAANARQNLGSTTVGDAVFIATNAAAARTTIGATTVGSSVFTLTNPSAITFLRLNADNTVSALSASDFRTALSLNTAATNPSSAFQPSSSALTNLSTNNGVNLTNIPLAGVVGALATNGSAAELTNFPASLLTTNGNGAGLTNLTAANITGTVGLASNVTGTIAISNGGTGATNAGGARTNLGATTIGNALFTATNATVGKAALDLSPTSNITLNQVDVNRLFVSDGTNGIQFETTDVAAITRTNLGIGAEATNTVGFGKIAFNTSLVIEEPVNDAAIITFQNDTDPVVLNPTFWNDGSVRQSLGFSTNLSNFWASVSIAAGRTNLGLPLAALTNTNNVNFLAAFFGANTNPVLVNTNGEVVSPTNFWRVAPIQTIVQNLAPITNSTNAATNSRNLYLYSLATNITGVTNTVTLPTNTSTFGGDNATIIHQGPTSSVTVVRQDGATNDLISINRFDESVKFIYENNAWAPYHNISFQEPIYFSGTNTSNNVAITRTNLGLGQASSVRFGEGTEANVGVGVGSTNVGLASGGATIQGRLGLIEGGNIVAVLDGDASPFFGLYRPITFQGTNATSNAATTRTNLFGHGGLSTNIDIKLNNNDGMRLYFTNGILTNAVTPIP